MDFNLLVAMTAQRSLAAMISIVANPNDEYRIGETLGVGNWTIFALILAVLWGMLFYATQKLRPGWLYLLWAWIGVSVGVSLVVFSEAHLPAIKFGG